MIGQPHPVEGVPSRDPWAKAFPDEFYRQIFRLKGWEWRGMKVNRPQVVANYTRDVVYARHLYAVVGLMRLSGTWDEFKSLVDRAYPKRRDTAQLDLFNDL